MDNGKRRAFIRKHVAERAKKRQDGVVSLTEGTAQVKTFVKRKFTDKNDRPSKKPKEVVVSIVGEMPIATQVPHPLRHGVGKGLMAARGPVLEKHPLLLREDSKHAINIIFCLPLICLPDPKKSKNIIFSL